MGVFGRVRLWRKGIVPYAILDNHPFAAAVYAAIDEINDCTTVRMIPRTSELAYIHFVYDPATPRHCASLGCSDVSIIVNVTDQYVLHNICHVLGMLHEHQRPDRDQHVEIITDNFASHDAVAERVLNCYERSDINRLTKTAYDITSVMHFGHTEGSSYDWAIHWYQSFIPLFYYGPQRTIINIKDSSSAILQSVHLSQLDATCINSTYALQVATRTREEGEAALEAIMKQRQQRKVISVSSICLGMSDL